MLVAVVVVIAAAFTRRKTRLKKKLNLLGSSPESDSGAANIQKAVIPSASHAWTLKLDMKPKQEPHLNKWSKNSDKKPHCTADFSLGKFNETLNCSCGWPEKSRCQGHWERCSATCRQILTSSTSKLPLAWSDLDPYLMHGFLRPAKSVSQMASRSVQPLFAWLMVLTDSMTDHGTLLVATGHVQLVLLSVCIKTE